MQWGLGKESGTAKVARGEGWYLSAADSEFREDSRQDSKVCFADAGKLLLVEGYERGVDPLEQFLPGGSDATGDLTTILAATISLDPP